MISMHHGNKQQSNIRADGRPSFAGQLGSSALAVAILMLVLAGLFRLATGQSPWPVFTLVEIPSAATAFALLVLTAPR